MSSCHPNRVQLPSKTSFMSGHPWFMTVPVHEFSPAGVVLMTVTTITIAIPVSRRVRCHPIIFTFHILKNNYFFRNPSRLFYPIAFTTVASISVRCHPSSINAIDSHVMEFQIPDSPTILEPCLHAIPLAALIMMTNQPSRIDSLSWIKITRSNKRSADPPNHKLLTKQRSLSDSNPTFHLDSCHVISFSSTTRSFSSSTSLHFIL